MAVWQVFPEISEMSLIGKSLKNRQVQVEMREDKQEGRGLESLCDDSPQGKQQSSPSCSR